MRTTRKAAALALALCVTAQVALAGPQPEVEGREYKLMLDPAQFSGSGSTLQTKVSNYWNALRAVIQAAPLSRTPSGSMAFDQQRTVMFYDVPSTCELNNSGYILRERVNAGGTRELTLKYRSVDRYVAGAKNVAGNQAGAETKFEDDITAPFKAVFSHSSKQAISAGKNINLVQDIIDLYPGFSAEGFWNQLPLAKVGNLTVYEKTYKGGLVDLGSKNGEFSLTLWYTASASITPTLVEVSFSYGDSDEQYTGKVAGNAKLLLEKMSAMPTWPQPNGATKTAWAYAYQPGFCQ
ncbi:hypothetical protein [Azohydromonas australica]|uniref:hypothetical protein n=1 Tax=Azohydromonas australica TaxID=364039 RepID=UPI000684829E|nr:hypothetical protein [Azohydromonas australica]